jgi:hypothetical protein
MTATQQQDWIRVEDELPKKRGEYLVWIPEFKSGIGTVQAHRSILKWTGSKFVSSFPVSHWHYLPEPPETQ